MRLPDEHAMTLCVFIFFIIFLFRNNVVREQLDENDFRRCYVFLSESIIPKVLDHSYIKGSLSTITKQLDNSVFKRTLQLNVLWTLVSSLNQNI